MILALRDLLLVRRRVNRGQTVFDFTSGSLPNGFVFSRSSSASRIKSDGTLEVVSNDVARFDYDPTTLAARGILIEPAQTNKFANSNAFQSWTTIGTLTRTADATAGPDGAITADQIQYTPGSAAYLYQSLSPTLASGTTYTFSVWTKSNTGATQTLSVFLPATGTIVGTIQALTTWSRQSLTVTSGANGQYCGIRFQTSSYDVFLAHAQLETGNLSSYYPTTTVAATRSADVLSFTIPSGATMLRYTFDNDTTQDVSVSPGAYTIPTDLNRPWIKSIMMDT